MKKLRITLDGKVYDVTVEVLEDDEMLVPGSGPSPETTPPPRAPVRARSTRREEPGPPRAGQQLVEGGDPSVITAPIAGTVQKILVSPGESVDAKAPVILLDAMKMDTYVYAPQAGRVAEVLTSAGATVQVGDRLLRVQPEG